MDKIIPAGFKFPGGKLSQLDFEVEIVSSWIFVSRWISFPSCSNLRFSLRVDSYFQLEIILQLEKSKLGFTSGGAVCVARLARERVEVGRGRGGVDRG